MAACPIVHGSHFLPCHLLASHLSYRGLWGLHNHLLSQSCEQVKTAGDQTGPPSLMAGSQAGAVVAVEVLVVQDVLAPVRIVLKLLRSSVDRTLTVGITEKDAR